jgi:hypothetical protein
MTDENAFGLLIAYLNIEDDEYAGEREEFVARYEDFTTRLRTRLLEQPPGSRACALEIGHTFYVELIADEGEPNLIAWLRETRALLDGRGFVTAGILTYGSSWHDDGEPSPSVTDTGRVKIVRASGPSEPLRRALFADAAVRGDEDAGAPGWGAGLYLDVEAVDALGRKPKNAPTILRTGGTEFFRAGS